MDVLRAMFEAATQEPCPRGCDAEIARLLARATKLRDSCQELLEIVQTRHGSLYSDAQERAERAIAEATKGNR